MNAAYRLREWFNKLEHTDGRLNREDVPFLMVQARHLIETAPNPSDYRVAAFYADWLVHAALDRSAVSLQVLHDTTLVILENLDPTGPIPTLISRVIGIPQLRAQLIHLFRNNGLPTVLFDYRENWRGFVMFLLWGLAGQPLLLPQDLEGRGAKAREQLPPERAYNLTVEALAIVSHKDVFHWALQVSGEKNVTMMGQVELAEDGDAFLPPPGSAAGAA